MAQPRKSGSRHAAGAGSPAARTAAKQMCRLARRIRASPTKLVAITARGLRERTISAAPFVFEVRPEFAVALPAPTVLEPPPLTLLVGPPPALTSIRGNEPERRIFPARPRPPPGLPETSLAPVWRSEVPRTVRRPP